MKFVCLLVGLVLALSLQRCSGVCEGRIVRFTKNWLFSTSPIENLEITCCTTWLTSLQLLHDNNDLTDSERGRRRISDIVTDGNHCLMVAIALLEENVSGDLQAKCNAEMAMYSQPCEYEIYTILLPTPSPSIVESTVATSDVTTEWQELESSVVMNTEDATTGNRSYQNTTATNVDNLQGNVLLLVGVVAAVIFIFIVFVGAVITVAWIKLRKNQREGSDQSDVGRQLQEQETSMTPQQPEDDISPNGFFRRQYSMPGHSTARSDFETIESAQDQQAHQVQTFMENDLPEDVAHSSQPALCSVQCTDQNMPDGCQVYVHI